MKLVIAMTGASGAIYTQRLLDNLDPAQHELHFIWTRHATEVADLELPGGLRVPDGVRRYEENGSMFVPFVSGSALFDAMVIIPASMGTIGRIANGSSDSTIARAADVFLKERRKLILVPRESPYNLIHLRNMTTLTEAGALILPASPGFYHRPQTIPQLVDGIIARVLDHLGIPHHLARRWQSPE
ncbi:MAG: UbiX family flavin prenyltransferase [Verrucomicrobiae bacterium]|nr:UbiX family flavin prenyltransferase [Verrucomicrobiae bacterium]